MIVAELSFTTAHLYLVGSYSSSDASFSLKLDSFASRHLGNKATVYGSAH